jgi:2-polyprenyl-3-methyl-5-hydroxy-6-metoxy-1,4-benzoquinol methylase
MLDGVANIEDLIRVDHAREVAKGERFEFGKNWLAFLDVLDDERIANAQRWLANMLGREDLTGLRFLDIGSGSGLSSLAARKMGADVTAFDYDPQSVACTRELRRRYFPTDARWRIEPGSALDEAYLESLGQFDIVYSWGVLHHTGEMWRGLHLAGERVAPGGQLYVAIYNDQGAWSSRWSKIKKLYCSGPVGRALVSATVIPYWVLRSLAADLVWGRNPMKRYAEYKSGRGMSVRHDWFDWLGGYPFEVAKPEAILEFYMQRGFAITTLFTAGGTEGCNEFVFRKADATR